MENQTQDPKPTVTNDETKKEEEKDELDFINPFLQDEEIEDDGEKEERKEEEDEDDDADDDKKKPEKKSVTNPLIDKIYKMERKSELDQFLSSEDGKVFKKFESKIREYALDKRAKGMSVSAIAYAVAGKNLLKIGAEMRKKSDEEAGKTETAGDGDKKNRSEDDKKMPDVSREKMNKSDFNDLVEKVKRGEVKL